MKNIKLLEDKIFRKNREIEQSLTRLGNFDIYFCVLVER